RTEIVALGAGFASAAKGAGRVGRRGREGNRRHRQIQGFPGPATRQGVRPLDMARDGIADVTYINPGYQPGRFPIIGAGELPFLMSDAKGGSMALDAWYRKYAEKEMKDVKFCLAFIH